MSTKKEIREIMKKKRKEMSKDEWEEKSLIIQKKFLESSYFKNFFVFLCYVHFDREVKTDTIIKTLLSNGRVVCIPEIDWKNNFLIPVRISSFSDIDFTKKIPQPKESSIIAFEVVNLSITPGVAFDIYGHRIGMGGGFYDRFFHLFKKIFKVALAFDFQVLDEKLPVEENDCKMDVIITEKRILSFHNFSLE